MKLLAVMQFTLKGTPFVYQGDEMGLTNYDFTSMDEITDVESKNYYAEHLAKGEDEDKVWKTILSATREHGRVLLPWNEKLPSYHANVQQEPKEEITDLYKMLIELRNAHKVFAYGGFEVLDSSEDRFVYKRSLEDEVYIIDCNLGNRYRQCYDYGESYEIIYASDNNNYRNDYGFIFYNELAPYEARIIKREN